MVHRLFFSFLKTHRGQAIWRRYQMRRGVTVGNYAHIPDHIRRLAPGRSFVDVGCMWGINGEYSFVAEEAGATAVKGVDVFGPTPEFTAAVEERGSAVEFVLGDIGEPSTLERVGPTQVVFCAGVLYHHPAPFDLLVALRTVCTETLILRTSTIPEVPGTRNMAVLWPGLDRRQRRIWNLSRLGVGTQVGITGPFQPEEGYGNWFWGLTPSGLRSLVELAGFRVVEHYPEPWAQTLVCEVTDPPFAHRLPSAEESRALGASVSRSGQARPS
ncbi:MAG: DUF1698 domain-containing protein [Thermoleophilia bacterium]